MRAGPRWQKRKRYRSSAGAYRRRYRAFFFQMPSLNSAIGDIEAPPSTSSDVPVM